MTLRVLQLLLQIYRRFISPVIHILFGPSGGCRFSPTCSVYFQNAIEQHGFWKGLRLGLFRIMRCHPGCKAGIDEVPPVSGGLPPRTKV